MPRKGASAKGSTQENQTTPKRVRAKKPSQDASPMPDGGKWAGSGSKTVKHSEGPAVIGTRLDDRGRRTRVATRTGKVNHPNHG